MSVTWGDYTLKEALSNSDGSWLESTLAKKHGLCVIAATNVSSPGIQPTIKIEDIDHRVILDTGSVPYTTSYNWYHSRYYYRYWYYRYRWYWYYRWHYYHPLNTRVVLIVPTEDGTVRAKAEGSQIFDFRLSVFEAGLTPSANKEVQSVGFSKSIQAPITRGSTARYSFQQDDIVVAIGVDGSRNYALADISYNGPAKQELFNILPNYGGVSNRVRVWRIKADGECTLTYNYCHYGRMAIRLMPNAEEKTTVPPSITEDRAYFEIQCEVDAFGNVERGKWFEGLYSTLKNSRNMGLRKSWTREVLETDTDSLGRPVNVKARRIEMWSVPQSKAGSVGSDALLFEDRAEADARIIANDNQW